MPRTRVKSALDVQADIHKLIISINQRSQTALTRFSDPAIVADCLVDVQQSVNEALKLIDKHGR